MEAYFAKDIPAHSVAHQPAFKGESRKRIHCWYLMVSGQLKNLMSALVQPREDTNEKRTGPMVHKSVKGGLKLGVGATLEHDNFTTECLRRLTYLARLLLEQKGV